MEKELKIEVPQGYEIDRQKSNFEKIVFKKIEPCKETMMIRDFFFPGNPDPFFEESEVTLKRLISQ